MPDPLCVGVVTPSNTFRWLGIPFGYVSVRETLTDWRYEGGSLKWSASIIAQAIFEGSLAGFLGLLILVSTEWFFGLQTLYAIVPTASGSRFAVWIALSSGICYAFTLDTFLLDR